MSAYPKIPFSPQKEHGSFHNLYNIIVEKVNRFVIVQGGISSKYVLSIFNRYSHWVLRVYIWNWWFDSESKRKSARYIREKEMTVICLAHLL